MGTILQGVYRRQANPTVSVPSPSDGDKTTPWWYDHLASHADEYAGDGFTHLQLPPVSMSSALDYPVADGYGVYNEYDLGTETRPTRFGSAERLQRLCAILRANGIIPLADWVPHQRSGGRNGVYNYKSATGQAGRFSKDPGCFRRRFFGDPGRVPQDPVASPWDDFMFGDELCPINAIPKGYVMDGLMAAGDWLYRRLDLGGCRNDDTKGQAFEAVRRWSDYGAMKGKPVIGEYADGNHDTLAWWVRILNYRCYTYDFEVKYRARDFCNAGSRYDMRRLVRSGLASLGLPYSLCAVTFIENADSDTNGFGSVVFNKLLGYAWILTAEGWPSIYYRDYAQEPYCYGLRPAIANLIWIHEHLANGSTAWRHAEYQFVVYERLGFEEKPGLLVGLNNDIWDKRWKHAYVHTNFGAHAHLHDYTGHGEDKWTDAHGGVDLYIPPNDNGKGYVCYSRAGLNTPNRHESWDTTQEFEGAADLDIPPARLDGRMKVTRIWVARGSEVRLEVRYPTMNGVITVYATDASGETASNEAQPSLPLTFTADLEGWYAVYVEAFGAAAYPRETTFPYIVKATYTAPRTLKGS